MQSVTSRIWTRVAMSISYDDNHYTTGSNVNVMSNKESSVWANWTKLNKNFLVFQTSTFLFLIFFNTKSSSLFITCLILMSSRVLMSFWIGLSVISRGFSCRFLKCSFHFRSLSSWQATFSFALKMHFLLLTTFTVCHALHDCLFSIEFLILSNCLKCIWIVLFGMCWLVLSELS